MRDSAYSYASLNMTRVIRQVARVCFVFMVFHVLLLPAYSAEMVVIRAATSQSQDQRKLETACQFYGLDIRYITVNLNGPKFKTEQIKSDRTVAIAIDAAALEAVNRGALLRSLEMGGGKSIPLLIFGMLPDTGKAQLTEWSGGEATGVNILRDHSGLHYRVGHTTQITQPLTDVEWPFAGGETPYFQLKEGSTAQAILSVAGPHQDAPLFIEEELNGHKVFLISGTGSSDGAGRESTTDNAETVFDQVAAFMMFTKYAAGEQGWHALGHYANLTIDDPWLHEPYGSLSYTALLGEMQKHNFHTTIAFIPWNYDRSENGTASLFRRFPDRFSICIHGDDHAHKEFTDYKSKPLADQISALKQSVVRMDQFRTRTGIPYDRVMVFPHSIAPAQTLEALKASDYLATINSQDVPMGSARPAGVLFALRPVTLAFGGLPSILRYSVADPTPHYRIAINEFLDNPLFFYAHQDYFAKSIGVFDGVADEVNGSEPNTRWRGVGEIVKHLYVVKLRDDSGYDVLGFSSSLSLENTSTREATFHVRKQETGPSIVSVNVDGKRIPYQLKDGYLELTVAIPAGQSRELSVQYSDPNELAGISPVKGSLYVSSLRMASDFRDMTLSKLYLGHAITGFYYSHGLTPTFVSLFACGVVVLIGSGIWYIAVLRKQKKSSLMSGTQSA